MNEMAGSIRIFRALGVNVYVHWAWLILFYYMSQVDRGFSTPVWNAVVVLAVFAIVLLHEYGHALATRSVGGKAETILLWPLGGVAFVQPPSRPGAVLWSIAAGPLVNVLLFPILGMGLFVTHGSSGDLAMFVEQVFIFNLLVLFFNLLPIYPLDGGQILQALLWFAVGRARSLRWAAGFGFVCALAGIVGALAISAWWFVLLGVFAAFQAWNGLQQARYLAATE